MKINERNLDLANYHARLSCPKWNRAETTLENKVFGVFHKWSRRSHRRKYRAMLIPGQGANTYPWPFSDEGFANWDEDDSPESYSLVSDPSGCVVKYATSYCAWKIYEVTGTWPQRKTHIRMDAKNWQQFLGEAGYNEVVEFPAIGGRYVGINPDEGEFGVVVWYEGDAVVPGLVVISTYKNKKFYIGTDKIAAYKWIKIK